MNRAYHMAGVDVNVHMRHGRKSRSIRVDGYKRHVLHDLNSGLIRVVGLTPANAPEASVTTEINADLERQLVTLKELHIDRVYLSSHLVRERSDELEIYCKAWPVLSRFKLIFRALHEFLTGSPAPLLSGLAPV